MAPFPTVEDLIRDIVREELAAAGREITLASREWFTSDAAADYLGISRAGVHQLVHEGRLPRNQPSGHKIMLKREQLNAYLAQRAATPRMCGTQKRAGTAQTAPPTDTRR